MSSTAENQLQYVLCHTILHSRGLTQEFRRSSRNHATYVCVSMCVCDGATIALLAIVDGWLSQPKKSSTLWNSIARASDAAPHAARRHEA